MMQIIIFFFFFFLYSGAATSARLFNEALAKIAMNAQHSGTSDIGKSIYHK